MKFPLLFKPGYIGRLKTKNRIIFPPISTNFASPFGEITERFIHHYERIAKGGAGIVTVENLCIDYPEGKHGACQPRIDKDDFIPGFSDLVDAIHKHNTLAFAELAHPGGRGFINLSSNLIKELIEKYAQAAYRLKLAGFDGVEIQGGHSLLVNQFLSPLYNKRRDGYGGSIEKRTRFAREIREGIKRLCGDFPVSIRLGVKDFVEGGNDVEEGKEVAKVLENSGYDCIQGDVGFGDKEYRLEPMGYEEGWRVYLASEIKKVLRIPVVAVGVIRHPDFAERIIKEGKADFIALGRTLLADPDWPKKARSGDNRGIRPCIGCNECVRARHTDNRSIRCSVNPEIGRMREELKIEEKKRILVVGGGPAGVTAAVNMRRRGNDVYLFEKGRLGGTLNIASIPPGKNRIREYVEYLREIIKRHKIKVRYKKIKREDIEKIKPDLIVVATGGKPLIPDIEGIKGGNVFTPSEILKMKRLSGKVYVVCGAGLVGCEIANFLASKKKRVKIVEMLSEPLLDTEPITKNYLLRALKEKGVDIYLNTKVVKMEKDGVIAEKRKRIKGDRIVCAFGMEPDTEITNMLKGYEYVMIGDAKNPRKIIDAVREGYDIEGG